MRGRRFRLGDEDGGLPETGQAQLARLGPGSEWAAHWSDARDRFGGRMHLRVLRFAALLVPVLLLGGMSLSSARAQEDDELARQLTAVFRLYGQGKFAEAVPLAERSVAVARTRHGEMST